MFHIKKYLQEEQLYLSILLSLFLNTLCSRLVDQTDLIMMRRISEDAAAALLSVKSISFLDFIVALSVVPIFGIFVRKTENQNQKEKIAANLFKKYLIITIFTVLVCTFTYPLLIKISVRDKNLKYICLHLIVFLILNLPFKMLQFLFSTFLCIFKKANFVSLFWIITVCINFLFNFCLIKVFGYTGCLISTIIVTSIVCLAFFLKLSKDFNFSKYIFTKCNFIDFSIQFKPIISEGFRIVIEQIASYCFFFMSINLCSQSNFTNIGIISAILSLLLSPSIASMRGTSLSLSDTKIYVQNKIIINLTIGIFISFTFFFNVSIYNGKIIWNYN